MSRVDSRYPELDLFLQRWRRRLNFRFLAGDSGFCLSANRTFVLPSGLPAF